MEVRQIYNGRSLRKIRTLQLHLQHEGNSKNFVEGSDYKSTPNATSRTIAYSETINRNGLCQLEQVRI
jgi:hypothetical protein